jgi:hypothetical protein
MSRLARILIFCGLFFGLVALVSDEGAFACVTSITTLTISMLLFEANQRRANKAA